MQLVPAAAPKAEYNRLKTLFRIILLIPPCIIAYAMQHRLRRSARSWRGS